MRARKSLLKDLQASKNKESVIQEVGKERL